jgi:hypothetical protein
MDINEILAEVGITVPEEKVQQFNKLVRTNYKSAAEVNKLRGEIDNLKESVSKLTVDNENLTKSNKGVEDIETKHKTEIESLTAKIAEYEGKLKDIELTKTIKGYFKDSKFISKRVEDSVIEEIKKKNFEFKDGKLEGIDTYIEELKKESNVFETENQNTKQVFMHTGKQKQENVQGNTSPFLNALYKGLDTNKSDK